MSIKSKTHEIFAYTQDSAPRFSERMSLCAEAHYYFPLHMLRHSDFEGYALVFTTFRRSDFFNFLPLQWQAFADRLRLGA